MQQFEFKETIIEGLVEIIPFNDKDERGEFVKDYSQEVFENNGVQHTIKEVFYTTSQRGVIRGLHFQRTKQQVKLVRCISGHIWDVVIDLRKDSPTFKKWLCFDLTGKNHIEILVPEGCAHGFLALEDSTVSYKCGEKFYNEYDDGIKWDDPNLNIEWPIELIGGKESVINSNKDKNLQSYKEFINKYGGF